VPRKTRKSSRAIPEPQSRQQLPAGIVLQTSLHAEGARFQSLAWSPDGLRLAAGTDGGEVLLWNVDNWELVHRVQASDVGEISALSWSSNGRWIAAAVGRDGKIAVFNAVSGHRERVFQSHTNFIDGIAMLPSGNILAVGSGVDDEVRIYDWTTGEPVKRLLGHQSAVGHVAWRADGQRLVSASADNTAIIWDPGSAQIYRRLEGHTRAVPCVAWTPDGQRIVTGGFDSTVRIWKADAGEQIAILEGHADHVWCVAVSSDGRLVASYAADHTVRIWSLDTFEITAQLDIAVLGELLPLFEILDFHPARPLLAVISDQQQIIRIFELDVGLLLGAPPAVDSARYANAKVVLAGDTGVGKSGLANRFIHGRFEPTDSTHARRALTLTSETIDDPTAPGRRITRETLLWDLAGQPGYRLVHQLSLDDAAVALVLFDARSETDPFGAATYWAKALDQVRSNIPIRKFLVAARTDRGGVGVSAERLDRFREQYGFETFFRTSALTGEGCDTLRAAILEAIDWNRLPIVSSNSLLTGVRTFVHAWKQEGNRHLLLSAGELYEAYCDCKPQASTLPWEEFAAYLRRLHQADVITLLDYGAAHQNLGRGVNVLLEPTAIDAYASAITIAARDEPDGLGHLPESDVLKGQFPLEARERLSEPAGERKVLVTVAERFLERDIALRERIDGVDYLVFPSQYTREAPFPGSSSYGLRYDFSGPVESIFATLVVRLAYHRGFKDRRFYRNAASYDAVAGGRCILLFEDREEGRGRMSVFFEEAAPQSVQQMFLQYVYEHLLRKAVPGSITRRRAYHCPKCRYLFDDEVVERRLARGADHIICPNCDYQAPLYDLILHDAGSSQATIGHIDADARDAMHRQLAVTAIQGKKRAGRYDVLLSYAPEDGRAVLWLAECLQSLGLRPWLDVWEQRLDQPLPNASAAYGEILSDIRSAVICTTGASSSPWQSEAQRRALVQYARDTKRVVAALLPRAGGSTRRRDTVPDFVDRGHVVDLRSLNPNNPQPLLQLVTTILGRNQEDQLMAARVAHAITRKLQDESARRAFASDHPTAAVTVQMEPVLSLASPARVADPDIAFASECLRAQIAEVIGMPSEFVMLEQVAAAPSRVKLRFANPPDALRLFAMVRTGDPFMADMFKRWSIDVEQFQHANREASERLTQPSEVQTEHATTPTAEASQPLQIIRLELKNFRCFPYLLLEFDRTSTLDGRWTCLAGINGAGKTCVLQALCLALLGHPTTHELGEGLLARVRRLEGGTRLDAAVNLWCRDSEGEQYVSLRLTEQGTASESYDRGMRAFWDRVRSSVVLSYGATRNLSEYLDSRHNDKSAETQRQITLFDPLARIVSAETLLQTHPPDSAFTRLFTQLLADVFAPDIKVVVHDGEVQFRVEDEPVSAVDLPDGFRSSVAWLADLCEAWCQKFPQQAVHAMPADIQALVLLDEIDLHLHPSLQRRLVPALRKALPGVQWIVTTHAPLVLSSFDRNEIIALDRSEPSGVRELDRQILGWTTDEVINWLMGTEATSAALDEHMAEAEAAPGSAADRSLAELLSQSPEANEEEARHRIDRLVSRLDRLA
jgi:WD40 repeat protein/GTPase SAR1 family protein